MVSWTSFLTCSTSCSASIEASSAKSVSSFIDFWNSFLDSPIDLASSGSFFGPSIKASNTAPISISSFNPINDIKGTTALTVKSLTIITGLRVLL